MMNNYINFAYSFNKNGKAAALHDEESIKESILHKLTWVHVDISYPEAYSWLEQYITNASVLDAIVDIETRPRMLQIDSAILLILRGVNLHNNCDPEDMISIRLWLHKNMIISVQRRQLKTILDIQHNITNGIVIKNTGDFVCTLVERLFEKINPIIAQLNESIDNIEEKVVEYADINLRKPIVEVRTRAIIFKRYMNPQKIAIESLYQTHPPWITAVHKQRLYESNNHIIRYVEDLDAIRERAQIIKDELASILADKLNKNMYILSVVAAVFLPLGFLTGLFGVNVGGIPGGENSNAFWIFCLVILIVTIIQIAIFKKLKWL